MLSFSYKYKKRRECLLMDVEKKKAAFDYINSYQKEKYDRITIIRPKGEKEKLTELAREKGYKTLTEFINACVDEKINRIRK